MSSIHHLGTNEKESSSFLRLRYLSLLQKISKDCSVLLYLTDLKEPLKATLNIWCPSDIRSNSKTKLEPGFICVKDLHTPLGVVCKARIRESDVLAIQAFSD
ncbi:unnamed protein product [Schistosoma margrebowiei]|uniref:Uncharacterized protein n=1 Tax=Schistosoma margrebowiei TaxID=48269 RepID=A0AA84Z711_9TREM|nr:unnamed protein product [Schistosoma margrebowiei]